MRPATNRNCRSRTNSDDLLVSQFVAEVTEVVGVERVRAGFEVLHDFWLRFEVGQPLDCRNRLPVVFSQIAVIVFGDGEDRNEFVAGESSYDTANRPEFAVYVDLSELPTVSKVIEVSLRLRTLDNLDEFAQDSVSFLSGDFRRDVFERVARE